MVLHRSGFQRWLQGARIARGSVPDADTAAAAVCECQSEPGQLRGSAPSPCPQWELPRVLTHFLEPQTRWVSKKTLRERASCEAAQQLGVQSSLSDSPAGNGNFPLFLCNKESNPKGAQHCFCADINTCSYKAFPLGRSSRALDPFQEPRWVIQSLLMLLSHSSAPGAVRRGWDKAE